MELTRAMAANDREGPSGYPRGSESAQEQREGERACDEDGEAQARWGPGTALRLGVPWGRVPPDEPSEGIDLSPPLRARGGDVRPDPPSARRGVPGYSTAAVPGADLTLRAGVGCKQAGRRRRREGRRAHRRHHARSVTIRVRPGPHGALDGDRGMRRPIRRRGIHDRWRLRSRRLRSAGLLCSDRRRCRGRRRCRRRGRWSGWRLSGWGCRRGWRCGCGRWLGSWGGRRHGCRRRVDGGTSRRKQRERVDVRVAVTHTYTQMDVRHRVLGLPGRAGLGDDLTFLNVRATLHLQRAEVRE